jgi:hypothetical protein
MARADTSQSGRMRIGQLNENTNERFGSTKYFIYVYSMTGLCNTIEVLLPFIRDSNSKKMNSFLLISETP